MAMIANAGGAARNIGTNKRRLVFKHALEKPYTTPWPAPTPDLQGQILDMLCSALHPVGSYFSESRRISKKQSLSRRRAARKSSKKPQEKGCQNTASKPTPGAVRDFISKTMDTGDVTADAKLGIELLKYVVLGINSTTRALEKQARQRPAGDKNMGDRLALVVVCRSDLEPQIISHLPALAHAALVAGNGIGNEQHSLRLIGLAKGAEAKLAAVVGQQRVSAIGIKSGSELLDPILEKVRAELPAPLVPWIGTEKDNKKHDLHKLAVRELHTTAPIKTSKSQQQQKQPKDKSHAQSV